MFELEQAIKEWKQSLRKNSGYEDGDIEELESHLRDRMDALIEMGHYKENAFRIVTEEIGEVTEIGKELAKSKKPQPDFSKQDFFSQLVLLIPSFFSSGLRNIIRRKGVSLLNLLGLSIGIAAAILIAQHISFEKSYDSFHSRKDHIYRVSLANYQNGEFAWHSATSYPAIAPIVKNTFPEVEEAIRLYPARGTFSSVVELGEKNTFREENGFFADSGFYNVFSIELSSGNYEKVLSKPFSIIISESMAEKYFPGTDPVGKVLMYNNSYDFIISGVFKDYPKNSHLRIDYLISYNSLDTIRGEAVNTSWDWYSFYTYLLLNEEASAAQVLAKFPELLTSNKQDYYKQSNTRETLSLQPLTDIYLYSKLNEEAGISGNGYVLKYLALIGIIILLIAWINYVNLTTAKSVDRAKEVGIRKTSGATKIQLLFQFLSESLFINILGCVIALLLVYFLQPLLTEYSSNFQPLYLLNTGTFWLTLVVLIIIGTIISGLYPAFILSSFLPVSILKGSLAHSVKGIKLRKGLVTVQFAISLILIVVTFTIYKQVNYMRSQEVGLNIEEKLVLRGPVYNGNDPSFSNRFKHLKSELKAVPGVAKVSNSSYVPGQEIRWTRRMSRDDIQSSTENTVYMSAVDYEFFDAYELNLLAGRNFSESFTTDSQAILINKEALNLFGFLTPEDAIQQSLSQFPIIGVFDNYYQSGLNNPFIPMVLVLQEDESRFITLQIEGNNLSQTIASVRNVFHEIFTESPLEFFWLDSYFNRLYLSDQKFGYIFSMFSALAIFISCLGLFGLASLIIINRKKEIGIRKVLGANALHTAGILLNEFWKLLLISASIGFPIAYLVANSWLKDFPLRIKIGVEIFFFAFITVSIITVVSIGYQLVRTIKMKPIDSIKSE